MTPVKGLVDPERSQNPQFESHCLKGSHNEGEKKSQVSNYDKC